VEQNPVLFLHFSQQGFFKDLQGSSGKEVYESKTMIRVLDNGQRSPDCVLVTTYSLEITKLIKVCENKMINLISIFGTDGQ